MKVKMNRPMAKLIKELGVDLGKDKKALISSLPQELRTCSWRRHLRRCLVDSSYEGDKTEFECRESKIHISDFVNDANTPYEKKKGWR